MSHYVEEELEITDKAVLLKVLKEMGWDASMVICEEGRHLIGYHGDTREQTADITIPRQHIGGLSNDVGFAKQPNGKYKLILSEYDTGLTKQFGHKMYGFKGRFKTDYGVGKIRKQVNTTKAGRGWSMKVAKKNGKTTVTLTHR